jgi:hypothetical protein
MADPQQEVFRAQIEIALKNDQQVKASLLAMRDLARQVSTQMQSDLGNIDMGEIAMPNIDQWNLDDRLNEIRTGLRSAIADIRQGLGGDFADIFSDVDDSLTKSTRAQQSWANASRRLGLSMVELRQHVDAGRLSVDKFGAITEKSMRRFQTSAAEASRASVQISALMTDALQQTRGFREGISLVGGGDVLLGLRTAFIGTGEAAGKFGKTIDGLRSIMARLNDDTTKEEKALNRSLESFQSRSIALRNSLEELKAYSKATGTSTQQTSQLAFAMNNSSRAIMAQVKAAQINGQVSKAGLVDMRQSVSVMREQVALFRRHALSLGESGQGLVKYADSLEEFTKQQEREIDIIEKRSDRASKSKKERQDENKETEKQGGILKRLISSLRSFNKSQDDASRSSKEFSRSIKDSGTGLLRLVGAFAAASLAADALRSKLRGIGQGFRTIKQDLLGFGVVDRLLKDLFTGTTEFAARLEQMGKTLNIIGQQAGASSDFVQGRFQALRDANISATAASDLMIRTFALGTTDIADFTGRLEGTAEGVAALRDIMGGDEGIAAATAGFVDDLDALAVNLESGEAGIQDMTLTVFRMAAAIEDPTQQMQFLIEANRRGVLGMEALALSAQNAAAALGKDSADALLAFTNATQRATTEAAEQYGIVTNASQFMDRYGEVTGQTAKELNTLERQQSVMLGVIQETLPFMEVYAEVQDTAGKKISSLRRIVEDAKQALGNLFLPVLNDLIDRFREFVEQLTRVAQSEAAQRLAAQIGELVSKLSPVGTVLRVIVDNFGIFATVVGNVVSAVSALLSGDLPGAFEAFKNAGLDAITAVALFIEDRLSGAFEWGWNLVVNLANGIIESANTVLVQAANFVGDLIGQFFAPGSPPEKGPLQNINEWGSGLISEIAGGMTEGATSAFAGVANATAQGLTGMLSNTFRNLDLGSLRAIRDSLGTIRGIFQSMVSAGTLDEAEVVPGLIQTRELMAQLMNQFEETGEISDEILDNIGDRLGAAGEDMKAYIRLQLELQQAKEEIEKIDQEIALAEQAGFVPAELRKRKEEAQKRVSEISEQMELQRELIAWQQESNDLVKQQIDLLKRIADQNERTASAAGRGQRDQWEAFLETYNNEIAALEQKRDLGIITEEEYQRARLGLEKRYIDTAIALGKPLSEARIQAFKDLKAQVEALSGKKGIEKVAASAGVINDELINLGNAAAKGFEEVKTQTQTSSTAFDDMRKRIEGTFDKLGTSISTTIKEKIEEVRTFLKNLLPQDLETAANKIKETLGGAFAFVSQNASGLLGGALLAIFAGPGLLGAARGLSGGVTALFAPLTGIFNSLIGVVGRLASVLLGPLFGGLKAVGAAIIGITGPIGAVVLIVGALVAAFFLFREEIGAVIDGLGRQLTPILNVVGEIVRRVVGVIQRVLENVSEALGNFVQRLLEMDSLRRLAENLGRVLRALAVVVGAILVAALTGLGTILVWLSGALDPFLQGVARTIDILASVANIIINIVIGALESLFVLITEGPGEAVKHLYKAFNRIPQEIENIIKNVIGLFTDLFGNVIEIAINGLDGFVGIVTGNFGVVEEFFANLGETVTGFIDDTLDDMGWFGDRIQDVGGAFGDVASGIGNALGLTKSKVKPAVDVIAKEVERIPTSLEGQIEQAAVQSKLLMEAEARRAQQIVQGAEAADRAMLASARRQSEALRTSLQADQGFRDSVIATLAVGSAEVSRLLEERALAQDEYHKERKRLLDEGNAEELAALDARYREEARIRQEAIGQSLIDLNQQILQERLARAELTGADAAAIVAQHQQQAQQIADHYKLPADAARIMSDEAVGSLRAIVLGNEELVSDMGLKFTEALGLMDTLELEGYDALSGKSKEAVGSLIADLALLQLKNGESYAAIQGTLSALPNDYQTAALEIIGAGGGLEQILAAFSELDRTVKPRMELETSYANDESRDAFQLQSPKTQLQSALEALVEFASENPLVFDIQIPEGILEFFTSMQEQLELSGEATESWADGLEDAGDRARRILNRIKSEFNTLRIHISGAARGAVNAVLGAFNRLSGAAGTTRSAVNAIVGEFVGIGQQIVAVLDSEFGSALIPGTVLWTMYQRGIDIAEKLLAGITAGLRAARVTATITLSNVTGPTGGGGGGPDDSLEAAVGGTRMPEIPGGAFSTDFGRAATINARNFAAVGDIINRIYNIDTLSFPGVTDRREAEGIWEQLEREVSFGRSLGQAGFAR